MTTALRVAPEPARDPVSNVLKWLLLGVAILCFALFAWATKITYDRAPQPDRASAERRRSPQEFIKRRNSRQECLANRA
jgi:hypothetical protein